MYIYTVSLSLSLGIGTHEPKWQTHHMYGSRYILILILILILHNPYFGGDTCTTPWLELRPCTVVDTCVINESSQFTSWLLEYMYPSLLWL